MKHKHLSAFLLAVLSAFGSFAQQPYLQNNSLWQSASKSSPIIYPLRSVIDSIQKVQSQPDSADLLIAEARKHLGKPYRYGGKGPSAFDCAGFARYVYLKFGYSLPGGSASQYSKGRRIKNTKMLQHGDLVFWQGREHNGRVGHTGIVTEVDTATGRFRFIHAATHSGVIHSYSTEPYYASRYVGACRLLGDRKKPEEPIPPKPAKKKRR